MSFKVKGRSCLNIRSVYHSPDGFPGHSCLFRGMCWKTSHWWGKLEGIAASKSADITFHLNTGCINLQIVLGPATPAPLPREPVRGEVPSNH